VKRDNIDPSILLQAGLSADVMVDTDSDDRSVTSGAERSATKTGLR
jgi:hypothetical protein